MWIEIDQTARGHRGSTSNGVEAWQFDGAPGVCAIAMDGCRYRSHDFHGGESALRELLLELGAAETVALRLQILRDAAGGSFNEDHERPETDEATL